jgi:hypothetical protein
LSSINRLGFSHHGVALLHKQTEVSLLVSPYVPVIHNSIHDGVGMSRDLSLHSTKEMHNPSNTSTPLSRVLFLSP